MVRDGPHAGCLIVEIGYRDRHSNGNNGGRKSTPPDSLPYVKNNYQLPITIFLCPMPNSLCPN